VGTDVEELVGVAEAGLVWVVVQVIDGVQDSIGVNVEEGVAVVEEVPVPVTVAVYVEVTVAVNDGVDVQL
jgi:hypothetical protein